MTKEKTIVKYILARKVCLCMFVNSSHKKRKSVRRNNQIVELFS